MGRLLFAIVLFAVGFLGAVWLTAVSTDREVGDLLSQNTLRQLLSGEEITLESAENEGVEPAEGSGQTVAQADGDAAETDEKDTASSEQNSAEIAQVDVDPEEDAATAEDVDQEESDTNEEQTDSSEQLTDDQFAFDAIESDDEGRLTISGTAPAEAPVELLSKDEVIASGAADSDGKFALQPEPPLTPGEHELSIRSETESGTAVMSPETLALTLPDEGAPTAEANNSANGETRTITVIPTPQQQTIAEAPTPDEETSPGISETESAAANTSEQDVVVGGPESTDETDATDVASAEQSKETAPAVDESNPAVSEEEVAEAGAESGDQPDEGETEVATVGEETAVVDESETADASTEQSAGETDRPSEEIDVAAADSAPSEPDNTVEPESVEPESEQVVETTDDATDGSSAPEAPASPLVEAIEIDGGSVFVTGSAAPQTRLRLSAGETELGTVTANENGRFLLEAEADIPVGKIPLRVETLGDDEAVLQAMVTSFDRTPGEQMTAVVEPPVSDPVIATQSASDAAEVMANSSKELADRDVEGADTAPPSGSENTPATAEPADQTAQQEGGSEENESEADAETGEAEAPSVADTSEMADEPADEAGRQEETVTDGDEVARQEPPSESSSDASEEEAGEQPSLAAPTQTDVASAPTDEETSPPSTEPAEAVTDEEDGSLQSPSETRGETEIAAVPADEVEEVETPPASVTDDNEVEGTTSNDGSASQVEAVSPADTEMAANDYSTTTEDADPAEAEQSDSAFERARSAVERAGNALRGIMVDDDIDAESEVDGDAPTESAQETESGADETEPASTAAPSSSEAPQPAAEDGDTSAADAVPTEMPASEPVDPASDDSAAEMTEGDTLLPALPPVFEVRRGDTIRSLSRLLYGADATDADFINVESGKVVSQSDLRTGMRLRLPENGPEGRTADLDRIGARLLSSTDK
ncbi:hypothetical protein [Notoacmeibacter sp. MSK16QG-6]|uniref:hypothetical protein n=1 Tax=Notoacmeibacter sp. MSK16QG-6 TaxID=2957982 RepID=UPI0020A144FE|nr:hypothetical protein [Notoacmeibacter sp. MSK16QG-6]MCP1198007.1 hypothetical protein [Notoacmeibacter sp. MSK16QG-6]